MKKTIAAVTVAFMLTVFAIPAFCETDAVNEQKSTVQQEKLAQPEQDVKIKEDATIEQEQANQNQIKKEVQSKQVDQAKQEPTKVEAEEPVTKKEEPAVKEEKPAEEKAEKGSILNYSKDKSRTEIEIKVGRTVNAKPEIDRNKVKVDDVYTVGIEVMAYSNSFLGFGAGIYNIFDSKLKDDNGNVIGDPNGKGDYEIAFTNPYLTLKSKILQFDSEIIRNVYIYGQLGYGFMRIKNAYETEDGMYWGIGGGVEIWHFLLDVNYATNFGKIKMAPGENKIDVRQTTLIVSVGYRFRL